MTEQSPIERSEDELAQRQALFQYTDLSHPVMQALFNWQLESQEPIIMED
ncbi:MAG: hypothetical protein HRT92_06250 [Piscirickettsiaceae bacterium]|nr:hypothetical protein [Piscirickettsiaceae bacterium]